MFYRTSILLGNNELQEKMENKNYIVCGLGGVGGAVIECLCRAGIKNITIIDGDTIDITNLNRQLISDLSNIGKLKTELWKERIHAISPGTDLVVHTVWLSPSNIEQYIGNRAYEGD